MRFSFFNQSYLLCLIQVIKSNITIFSLHLFRILRHNWCEQRDVTRQKSKGDSHSNNFVSQQGIYDTAEENAGYQELGQVSGPSHYDQLQRSQTE